MKGITPFEEVSNKLKHALDDKGVKSDLWWDVHYGVRNDAHSQTTACKYFTVEETEADADEGGSTWKRLD